MADNEFNIDEVQAKDTYDKLPLGWVVLFIGLIVWGLYYLYAFTGLFADWSQVSELMSSLK